ncbi:MAG: hypothetical protein OQK45_00135 [Sulfurovum sp.]|nr:hypothetical protein [Sulfurovum sp.]
MKRLIRWTLTGVSAFALSGCGGGGSYTVVDINNLEDGYAVTYSTGLNTPRYDISFCLNEYNITLVGGDLESNGSFSIDNQFDRIVFNEDANGSDDFQIKTSGSLQESQWYPMLDMNESLIKNIQITDIVEMNCTI